MVTNHRKRWLLQSLAPWLANVSCRAEGNICSLQLQISKHAKMQGTVVQKEQARTLIKLVHLDHLR